MTKPIVINELDLVKILKHRMSEKDFFLVMDELHDKYSGNAIPVDYICDYAQKHDAVCQVNLAHLIINWEEETE